MTLPEPKPGELTVEVDRDTKKLLDEALAAMAAWSNEVTRLKRKLQEEMGEATAALVDGMVVATWRPRSTWRQADLIKDYPDLTAHYMTTEVQTVFDVKRFAQVHPDIAVQYQTRAFEVK
jgi:hypothetical protein